MKKYGFITQRINITELSEYKFLIQDYLLKTKRIVKSNIALKVYNGYDMYFQPINKNFKHKSNYTLNIKCNRIEKSSTHYKNKEFGYCIDEKTRTHNYSKITFKNNKTIILEKELIFPNNSDILFWAHIKLLNNLSVFINPINENCISIINLETLEEKNIELNFKPHKVNFVLFKDTNYIIYASSIDNSKRILLKINEKNLSDAKLIENNQDKRFYFYNIENVVLDYEYGDKWNKSNTFQKQRDKIYFLNEDYKLSYIIINNNEHLHKTYAIKDKIFGFYKKKNFYEFKEINLLENAVVLPESDILIQ